MVSIKKPNAGGGWQAIRYTLKYGKEVGLVSMLKASASHNACKTCALGMGGQQGGMRNEAGRFPEVCKKSFQAMAADMRGRIARKFFDTYTLDQIRGFTPRELEALGRLAEPVVIEPGDTHYRTISWEEAYGIAAEGLRASTPERSFFYVSGRSSNEAGFLLQLFARAYGTNHVSNCSYYCHQASGVGLSDSIGTGTATVSLEDVEACDLLFLIGGNPASNHPRLMTSLMKMRRRGGHVVVVNPLREVGLERFRVPSNPASMLLGSEIASLYVQPRIGGDIAFLVGVAKVLLDEDGLDQAYIDRFTEGFEAVEELVRDTPWEKIVSDSGVPEAQIRQAAEMYRKADKAIFAWTMGITHHEHGVQNVQWIVNLALARGMVGKPGAGVMPIRGHSNVQGMGTVGVSPSLTRAALDGLREIGVEPPAFQGHDTLSALEASSRGEMDFALCLGGNLFGASPDADFVRVGMSNLKTVVYLSTTLNTGHFHGMGRRTLILPVLARDEETQSTTQESMFNFVRLSDGGIRRFEGPRSEVEVLTELALRALPERPLLDWSVLRDHDQIRKLIARLVPKLAEIESIGQTRQEFHVPGRVLHEPSFATEGGKARFRAHPIPGGPNIGSHQLRLMTVRSEGQFNTVVYEEEDIYRGQERRDVVLMNARDMARMNLLPNQPVCVRSAAGQVPRVLARCADVAEGSAVMYFPEANVLVPRDVDPRSKTPAYKCVIVTIEPSNAPERAGVTDMAAKNPRRLNAC